MLHLLTHPARWRFLLLPEYTGACAGGRSCCPYSALNHVLGSLGAAILGKQVFAHFKKGFSLLINPVHILIKIQTLTLSGTPNVPDIWAKSNAFLLQPYLSVCFHNDPCHFFCFLFQAPVTLSPSHHLFLPVLFFHLHLGIVLLPILD